MARQADPFDPHVLVLKAKQGDMHAFDLLVQHYEPQVKKLINRYVDNPTEVKDLSQETFIKMFKSLKNFRGDSQLYTWLYRVAINTIKNYQTYQGRHPCSTDFSLNDEGTDNFWLKHLLKESATPENLLLSEETEALLLQTIRNMSVDLRLALLLRDIEGCSYRAIADLMHCPIGTVRSRISRARTLVMDALNTE